VNKKNAINIIFILVSAIDLLNCALILWFSQYSQYLLFPFLNNQLPLEFDETTLSVKAHLIFSLLSQINATLIGLTFVAMSISLSNKKLRKEIPIMVNYSFIINTIILMYVLTMSIEAILFKDIMLVKNNIIYLMQIEIMALTVLMILIGTYGLSWYYFKG